MFSPLLIQEPPLQVLPSLAVALKLGPAMLLQQVHYWTLINQQARNTSMYVDGYWWTFATYDESTRDNVFSWVDQFPFFSEKTIRTYVKQLQKKGVLVTAHHSTRPTDRTTWYRVDYAGLNRFLPNRKDLPDGTGKDYRMDTANFTGSYKETIDNRLLEENKNILTDGVNPDSSDISISQQESDSEPLNQYITISDQVDTLLEGFTTANNQIAFLRFAYMQVIGTDEEDTPDYPRIGGLFKKACSVLSSDLEAGRFIIRSLVMCTIADYHKTGFEIPIEYVSDLLDKRRNAKRKEGFEPPTKEQVRKVFADNGVGSKEAESWRLWMESKAWDGVTNWEPLAVARAMKLNADGAKPDRVLVMREYAAAVGYWQKKRASVNVKFEQFFKPVDSKGNDWVSKPNNAGNPKPQWMLIASDNMIRED